MASIWFTSQIAEEIMKDDVIFNEIDNIVTDIVTGNFQITKLIENMATVLTNKDPDVRAKGMRFFTEILKRLPRDYLTDTQLKYISQFYIDRLKDNHRVIPFVLEGYLSIVEMNNYEAQNCNAFLTSLFNEVPCQSQVRQDRYNIYVIIKNLIEKDCDYIKAMGPDLVYGFITAMDGERDPRNLIFLFSYLPTFMSLIPIGHLVNEMFEVISCYYPIDFNASPDDPAAVTRDQLAEVLAPCLCAIPEFGESCLILLIEKLDSSLRLAKLDSLRLLVESCKKFKVETYVPFLKTLWSSIQKEICGKTDDELKMAAHQALSALTNKLSTSANTDQTFENFVKGIIISSQTSIANSTTVAQFVQATKPLLTVANSSKEACVIVVKAMIPAALTFYGLNNTPKLQIVSLDFLGDLADLAKHWDVNKDVELLLNEIPQLCLTAASNQGKEFQIVAFKTLIRVKDSLQIDLIVPFVEILTHNVQNAQDCDLIAKSVETINVIARKYPELIMDLVVKGKCDLNNLGQDKTTLAKRLDLLCNLASIDDFTKVIIEEMLKMITATNKEDSKKVIRAMNVSISNSNLYSKKKVEQLDSDHGLIDSVISWLITEISESTSEEFLTHGFSLITNTIASLPEEKQREVLSKHTDTILNYTKKQQVYFLILEALYNSLRQTLFDDNFKTIMNLSLKLALESEHSEIRTKSCILVAHFLNKADYGEKFDALYGVLKDNLLSCSRDEERLCPKLILLYGWLVKGLILRGSELFMFWLTKIVLALSTNEWCNESAASMKLIMIDSTDYLNYNCHCRTSLFYKQRIFQSFKTLTEQNDSFKMPSLEVKQAFLLSWAYVLGATPKSVLNRDIDKILPHIIDSLEYDNIELLVVMTEMLTHFVTSKQTIVTGSLQTILPRLIHLSKYVKSMDVRIKSLECLFEIANNNYPTRLLLPHKQDLLFDLAPSLDDKKRLVRNMAVKARTRWYLVGSPGEQ